uniref:Uncharacterized protein n=1 Tax=Anguilla anguilla TaxID=7936 RepID=A0A0E9QCR5_ANGAN
MSDLNNCLTPLWQPATPELTFPGPKWQPRTRLPETQPKRTRSKQSNKAACLPWRQ